MAIENVKGLAVFSGKGGVGKSVISLNLALGFGSLGIKTLLFDAGGGDLANLTNTGCPDHENRNFVITPITENVGLFISSISDIYGLSVENMTENLMIELAHTARDYECVVFDCPTGSNPAVYLLSGLVEKSLIISTPDPTSIAGAYLLLKSLFKEGFADRCEVVFSQVDSGDEAAILKTKFDILTRQFLEHRFELAGYIHRDPSVAESVLEQQPLMIGKPRCRAGQDFYGLALRQSRSREFHFETASAKSHLK
jgi:flagellar biosynthesis protein FlhG